MQVYDVTVDAFGKAQALFDTPLPKNALCIGNFDGVHLGHQAMLTTLKQTASKAQLATAVMVFEPQPREFFAAQKHPNLPIHKLPVPARLTNLSEKKQLLANFGIDVLFVAHFDEAFRSLTAKAYADLLKHQLNVEALVVGDDFKFGQDRSGDADFLHRYGLQVHTLNTITHPNDAPETDLRISSTRIRELLAQGKLAKANTLLGYDYQITGPIVRGNQIGAQLGFATANVALDRLKPAIQGVYGVDACLVDNTKTWADLAAGEQTGLPGLRPNSLFGTANIGIRPSIKGQNEWRFEVHFPNYHANLYGCALNVRLLHYLHPERSYANLQALKQGIALDVDALLKWRAQAKT